MKTYYVTSITAIQHLFNRLLFFVMINLRGLGLAAIYAYACALVRKVLYLQVP